MAVTDRTSDFRSVCVQRASAVPDANRRQNKRNPRPAPGQADVGREFVAEGYAILKHVNDLTRTLASVRKPYLDVHARPTATRSSRDIDLSGVDSSWAAARHLSNEERDQIDIQARLILTRCADRVKQMEALEQRRSEVSKATTSPLSRLLPTRLLPPDTGSLASAALAAHHSSITWYLNRRLAAVSAAQKDMQEERVRREMERARTLGSGAAREAALFGSTTTSGTNPTRQGSIASESDFGGTMAGSWIGGAASTLAASLRGEGSSNSVLSATSSLPHSDTDISDPDSDDEMELSQSQILQFEQENSQLLRNVQDTLQSVQLAESRVLEIAALQTELLAHLQTQTEVTEQLYEDAIVATGQVEKGNVQLKEAKRRANDSRLFVLIFLLGASFSLLFLHYY